MTSEPVLPRYGTGALCDLLPAIGAHFGVSGCDYDPFQLPTAQRWVVVLIDGLGWHNLLQNLSWAPYLGSLMQDHITAGVPATTVTSITSLGTGLPPGSHGVAGYRYWVPEAEQIFSPLKWGIDVPAEQLQPESTMFERFAAANLQTHVVIPAKFTDSGLTQAALRGAHMLGQTQENDYAQRTEMIVEAVAKRAGLVYAYDRRLDHTGHGSGADSVAFSRCLASLDQWCEQLRETLDDDVRLIITGDHGMVDVPQADRILYEDHPVLQTGVAHLAGESRFRHIYATPGTDCDGLAARWQDFLADKAWVSTREQAIENGWFGAVNPRCCNYFGDVVVAMKGTYGIMTQELPGEWNLIGMHGSLTAPEMLIPLLID